MRAKHKNFDYFEAFEKQTQLICKESALLIEAIENFTTAQDLSEAIERAHEIEHEGDMLSHDIHTVIARDFLPPFDREDILELCEILDDILDTIEAVIQSFYMFDVHIMHEHALEFAQILHDAACALNRAMKEFENFKKSAIKEKIIEVNDLEEKADHLYIEAIRSLHTKDRENPMRVIVWSQLYKRMEDCVDACEHVADVMHSICIRNN